MVKAGAQAEAKDTTIELSMNSRDGNIKHKYPDNYISTTKYTLLTFFPKNMFQQFQKVSNIFFLLNMIIALVPGVSPVFPITTILPLVVVVAVAAARDAYEDHNRYVSDKSANGQPVTIVNEQGNIVKAASKDIQVGDILYIEKGGEIVCDCMIVSTALEDGAAFVETANLDGETNLKPKQAKTLLHQQFNTPHASSQLSGTIQCDSPNNSLHKWQGKVKATTLGQDLSVDADNFLLRGCQVRNVDWVMAVAVYTGVNTKMFLNLIQKPPKSSRLDKKLNRLITMILAFQQVVILIICIGHIIFRDSKIGQAFYLEPFNEDPGIKSFFFTYMTYFILLSLMMPISLFVSLEFCKLVQAAMMEWDDQICNDKGDHLRARTSSLNEELSQVQYVFSDKTGTLTENLMRFAVAYAGGEEFDELKKEGSMRAYIKSGGQGGSNALARGTDTGPNAPSVLEVRNFLRLLAFNNNCIINADEHGKLSYDGSSTDEVALVSTAEINGYRLVSRTAEAMTVEVDGVATPIEVICIMPFTPERKMMSIVLRERDGTLRQYTKGADSCVYARLSKIQNNSQKLADAQSFLDKCAGQGLRTLCCAERIWNPAEFDIWKRQWDDAVLTVTADRDDKVHTAALAAEDQLVFVGCTAIEDKLQDEVPETIHFLLRCGIVVWVLTGDKRETAVNIAGTSRLLDPKLDLIIQIDLASGVSAKRQIEMATARVKEARAKGQKSSFVVDGNALETILRPELYEPFRQLGLLVNSAVCCRVTPLQKASVVAMFQELGSTSLGVGDGANDVSMIQEARVGIGILGLEGSQAERSADYAIPRFKHLRRLLAVHGRYSLVRNSALIQYSFYKNLVYSLTHVFYSFYNAFTGQTIYDSWVSVLFNMIFTFLPPVVMGVVDYDVRADFCLKHAGLYAELRSPFALRMSRASAFLWFLLALFHAWVIFYGTYRGIMVTDDLDGGQVSGMWSSGTMMVNLLLSTVLFQAMLSFRSWTWLHALSIFLSFLGYTVTMFGYAALPVSVGFSEYYWVPYEVYANIKTWLNNMLWIFVIFAIQGVLMVIRSQYFAIDSDEARLVNYQQSKTLPWKTVSGSESGADPVVRTADLSSPLLPKAGGVTMATAGGGGSANTNSNAGPKGGIYNAIPDDGL